MSLAATVCLVCAALGMSCSDDKSTDSPSEGACCLPGGSCLIATRAQCDERGGFWGGAAALPAVQLGDIGCGEGSIDENRLNVAESGSPDLYSLPPDDAAYVLDTFPIVRRDDEKRFGAYRTKDAILSILEQMLNADGGGVRLPGDG